MNIMELGVLLAQYSDLNIQNKTKFLQIHPELKNEGVISWALTASQMRFQTDDILGAIRYGTTAFELSREIRSILLGKKSAQFLAQVARQVGKDDYYIHWNGITSVLEDINDSNGRSMSQSDVAIVLEKTVSSIKANRTNLNNCWLVINSTCEAIFFLGSQTINPLINCISGHNIDSGILAILYLGMIHVEGLGTTHAIPQIVDFSRKYKNSEFVVEIANYSLAMMDYAPSSMFRKNEMRKYNLSSIQEFNRLSIQKTINFLIQHL